jgi:hypothetical protein
MFLGLTILLAPFFCRLKTIVEKMGQLVSKPPFPPKETDSDFFFLRRQTVETVVHRKKPGKVVFWGERGPLKLVASPF